MLSISRLLQLPQQVQSLSRTISGADFLAINSYQYWRQRTPIEPFDPVTEIYNRVPLRPFNYMQDWPWVFCYESLRYLLKDESAEFLLSPRRDPQANLYYLWGSGRGPAQEIFSRAMLRNLPVYFFEEPFLSCICPPSYFDLIPDHRFLHCLGLIVDDRAVYYDCYYQSRLELMLNDPNFHLTDEQLERSRRCIDYLVGNRLSKYNHQPLELPKSLARILGQGRGRRRILIVDQHKADLSIYKGGIHDATYQTMLDEVLEEHPDDQILLKIHPDQLSGKYQGCFANIDTSRLTILDMAVNPYTLLEHVDEVYTGTSQLGFEAALAGKKVVCYGLPFYAGWGFTEDRLPSTTRTVRRSLEEVFFCAYVLYTNYVDPQNRCRCSLERAMEYLVELRSEYFDSLAGSMRQ